MGLFSKNEPIIVKESSSAIEQLAALESLRGTLPSRAERQLEADIRAVKAGIDGERRVLFELKNSHMDMCVLQDLFLEFEGRQAQIDFLVLTRQRNFVIECKKLYGNIEVNGEGDFIRTYRGRREPEGIYSPFTQNKRHIQLIREMKEASRGMVGSLIVRGTFDDMYKNLVVLANEKTVIDYSAAPREIRDSIVRADRLATAIAEMNARMGIGRDKLPMKDVLENAEWFLERHKDARSADLAARYREMTPTAGERTRRDAPGIGGPPIATVRQSGAPETPTCPKCGAPMVVRTARRGARAGKQFFGCTRFPKCRGIVNIEPNTSK